MKWALFNKRFVLVLKALRHFGMVASSNRRRDSVSSCVSGQKTETERSAEQRQVCRLDKENYTPILNRFCVR